MPIHSYDIGSLIYHWPGHYILHQVARDLMVLSGVDRWFDELSCDRSRAMNLMTPDNTRLILDEEVKWIGLLRLASEIADLARAVEKELVGPFYSDRSDRETVWKHLNDNAIPLAPELVGARY